MFITPLPRFPVRLSSVLAAVEAKCLDPGELRSHLTSLVQALQERIMAEGRTQMELMRLSGVSLETSLGPFLRTADLLFSSGRAFIQQVRDFFQSTLRLIGSTSDQERAGRSLIYACQDATRIRSLLRMIDERLVGLLDSFRGMFLVYEQDALRIRRVMQLPLNQRPPQQPVEPGTAPGPGLRATSMAERAALAMVRTFIQQMAAIIGLMRQALQGIVQTIGVMMLPDALVRGAI